MTAHIDTLEIKGFKCFESLRMPLRPLTLFTGYNGAGKSTAIQPMLLLAQGARLRSWSANKPDGKLPLNGDLVRLGSSGDVLRTGSKSNRTRFVVSSNDQSVEVSLIGKAGDRVLESQTDVAKGDASFVGARMERLVHLSAVRSGPSDAFPIPDRSYSGLPDVGVDGRYASYWYHELADNVVDEPKMRPDNEGTTFRRQVDAWLDFLAPGASANVQGLAAASSLALQFSLSGSNDWKRPANVGYGLTYAFPVLVALLAAEPGDIVSIDSPEAHLHPRAQSHMGRMLAHFAAAGVQLLIETHSDHVLNGARLAVRDQVLPHDQIQLLFFGGAREGEHGVITPKLDKTGRIDAWPEGFFDQSEADIADLAGWN